MMVGSFSYLGASSMVALLVAVSAFEKLQAGGRR
jgi:hypothetical protein